MLLRGLPDWESCLHLVDSIVNSSAPCSVQEHLPSCVLGTPQPELQGHFMALTGVCLWLYACVCELAAVCGVVHLSVT